MVRFSAAQCISSGFGLECSVRITRIVSDASQVRSVDTRISGVTSRLPRPRIDRDVGRGHLGRVGPPDARAEKIEAGWYLPVRMSLTARVRRIGERAAGWTSVPGSLWPETVSTVARCSNLLRDAMDPKTVIDGEAPVQLLLLWTEVPCRVGHRDDLRLVHFIRTTMGHDCRLLAGEDVLIQSVRSP